MPEALPRRFGDIEPLQHRLSEDGDSGFAAAWRGSNMLFFTAATPCIDGSLLGAPDVKNRDAVWIMSLTLHRAPLHDPRWRDTTRRLFLRLAERLGAFFASGEVQRGYLWNGRGLRLDGQTRDDGYPVATVDGWNRLPRYPLWWTWYGPTQRSRVGDELPGAEAVTGGLFLQWTDQPTDRDKLKRLAIASCPVTHWHPPDIAPARI